MLQVNFIIGRTLGQNKMALVRKLTQKDDKLVPAAKNSGLMIHKAYFEASVEGINDSALKNLFCRNYNTIVLIKF